MHQIRKLKELSSRLGVAFGQSIEAKCKVENEDVVGAAPTGDAPTTHFISRIDILSIFFERWTAQLTRPHWWLLNIGSGKGLVPSGNKPLPEPMLTKFYDTRWQH